MTVKEHLLYNGFYLFLIPLLFNIPFYSKLPMDFFFPKPSIKVFELLEQFFRIINIISSLFLVIQHQNNPFFKKGIIMYILGIFLYFLSWGVLIFIKTEVIANFHPIFRALVVFAPSYLPLIWLIGIALVCNALWFIVPSLLFSVSHVVNFILIYQ